MAGRNKRTERKRKEKTKKRLSGAWISLDNMMGKTLCILLVVILTVGAFLAPKMINNLYDAGTLLQITYVDMNLSTYAVAYTSFPEKIEAIAAAKTAKEKLVVLPAEETAEKISDEELIRITNGEMAELSDTIMMLFWEDWWNTLTQENLVSRQKNTLYVQPGAGQEDAQGAEMAPVQFWMLTFELTGEQKKVQAELSKTNRYAETWPPAEYGSERLIVCLDEDFYKIYAIAIEGAEAQMWMQYERYGLEFPDIFGLTFGDKNEKNKDKYGVDPPGYITEIRMALIDTFREGWSDYWDVHPMDQYIYNLDEKGEISGCLVFQNETGGQEGSGTEEDTGITDVEIVAEAAAGSAGEIYDASYENGMEAGYTDSEMEAGYEDGFGERTLLSVGCSGQWSGVEQELWIQKGGCMEFFEMMQF